MLAKLHFLVCYLNAKLLLKHQIVSFHLPMKGETCPRTGFREEERLEGADDLTLVLFGDANIGASGDLACHEERAACDGNAQNSNNCSKKEDNDCQS